MIAQQCSHSNNIMLKGSALRQRLSKKTVSNDYTLPLPTISTIARVNDNDDHQHDWRRRKRRYQHFFLNLKGRRRKPAEGQARFTVITSITAFAIIGLLLHRRHQQRRVHSYAPIQYDFQCLNNPLKGVMNDDYCDCPDGSDEPLTSACSHLLVGKGSFLCTASFSTGEAFKLFPSRIHDGVIDCIDGADKN